MEKSILWSIIGLSIFGVSHGGFRHHSNPVEVASLKLATTETPQVNVSSVLSNYDGLNLIHDDDIKTIGFFNVTENVGVSFTKREGGDVKLLIDSKRGLVLTFQQLDKVSLIQNDEFRGDVLKASDLILQNYVCKGLPISGKSSEIESSSEDALSLWSDVYLHLGHPAEKGNLDFRSLKYVQKFSKRLRHLYLGSLKGLIGKGSFPLKQNLNRFLTISVGLHELFSKANGGLKTILAKDVVFEVNSLFNAKNGAEVLVYVLRQTGKKFDISTLWGDLLNNVEDLLDILAKLGGGENKNGVDESFAIIGHFWAAVHLRVSVTDFVRFLFESTTTDHWSQADDGDLQQVFKDVKNITDEQSKKYDSIIKVSSFVTFFTNLTVNSLIENNVNISELVEEWRKRDAIGGLKTITHITLKLFSPEKYSNLFFNGFTAFLNATSDPDAVKRLIPGVPLEDISGKGGSVWTSICKSYKIDEQLKKGGDANQILNGIPVFNEFSKIYKDALGNNFDFSKILNGGTLSEYLSKNPFLKPIQLGVNGFAKFIQESGNIIKHIFIDPIQHFLPIPNLGNPSSIPNLPFLPPGILPPGILTPSVSTEKGSDDKISRPTTSDDDIEEKATISVVATTKKPCEDCDDKESESSNKSTTSSGESASTENLSTSTSEETHLTASISTSSGDDNSENSKTTENSEETSKKTTVTKCDECEDKETKPSTVVVKVDSSAPASTEGILEFKQHQRHHVENRHHGHHSSREHHREKNYQKTPIVHQYKHHHHQNDYEYKHDTRKHQIHQGKHHEENNHHSRRHNHETHDAEPNVRSHKHESHDFKHHQRVQHAETHHSRTHHKQEEIQRN